MSPAQFHDHHHQHAKGGELTGLCPSPLKINTTSHIIKKSSPPPSSSSPSPPLSSGGAVAAAAVAAVSKPQQRHPVIIYTHSPKIIHTHPRDFMALVQKLTGLSRSEEERGQAKSDKGNIESLKEDNKNTKSDDNSSSSVITDENCTSGGDGGSQVNSSSCFLPPVFEPSTNPYLSNIPLFTPNSKDFLCSNNQPFFNYTDSLIFTPNMRSSISSSTLEAMNEFREY